ncbi:Fic/DOC family protein [Cellvibrio fontiphilus]|uniref:protein adenylyltransferase n=1 Tax=Cellvibrio fontiphilus TaxID=1815559 RepID=A0ABV7FK20_9GAMM
MPKYAGGECFKYPETEVLINKANIRTQDALDAFEADVTAVRLIELLDSPIPGTFDLAHLQAIHRHIFQDVYDWAGELRQVDIQKGGSKFGNWALVPNYLNKELKRIAAQNFLLNLPPEKFIPAIAHYLSEINSAHPFLEGNGRAQRAFCSQLAEQAGFFIDFEQIGRDEMIGVMIASFNGDEKPLANLLEKITSIIE